jgi:NADH-quinone oxidoreductase subunit E
MVRQLREVLSPFPADRHFLLQILQGVQSELGYISEEAIEEVARHLEISVAEVYGVATFYNQFRFIPYGKHHVVACLGTACHAMGGRLILEGFERELDIKAGGITQDHEWSLDRVGCIGCCTKAPVVVINDVIHAKMTPFKVEEVLAGLGLQKREKEETGEGEHQ